MSQNGKNQMSLWYPAQPVPKDETRNGQWNTKRNPSSRWSSQVSFHTADSKIDLNFHNRKFRFVFRWTIWYSSFHPHEKLLGITWGSNPATRKDLAARTWGMLRDTAKFEFHDFDQLTKFFPPFRILICIATSISVSSSPHQTPVPLFCLICTNISNKTGILISIREQIRLEIFVEFEFLCISWY